MGQVRRKGNLRIVIWSNDHRPSHVHVIKGKGKGELSASFLLRCPNGPPELREADHGVTVKMINRWLAFVVKNLEKACADWSAIHGDF
ncbi:DUF4160 domain-containing protein [Hyphomicrobium sp.]|uniref:DUF4160 domain-containing protein n=1 Tax=Hyphomicrobium sp. TaxID=82 RepID=UPI000FC376E9|nr:DUF4160 domain-containing protein [Hyphomicrobium sp.]RUO97996.1 MAG: DUF4160 domain-containing protein [Hyphomicrobium sp.]